MRGLHCRRRELRFTRSAHGRPGGRTGTARLGALLSLIVLLAACTPRPGPGSGAPELRVRARAPYVELENTGRRPIYYHLSAEGPAADERMCDEPATCPGLAPGQSRRLSYADIAGWEPGDAAAVIWWWHFERTPDGFRRDAVRQQRIIL